MFSERAQSTQSPDNGSAFPTELPPRPEGDRGFRRMCPGYRSFLPGFSLSSFSLKTGGDKELRFRRMCMIAVLVIRTANSIFVIVLNAITVHIARLLVAIIVGIIGFFIVAQCLHLIGSMSEGSRRVLGVSITKTTYDVFLFVMVILHLGVFALTFFVSTYIYDGVWFVFGLLIFLAAWTSTWEPEPKPIAIEP